MEWWRYVVSRASGGYATTAGQPHADITGKHASKQKNPALK